MKMNYKILWIDDQIDEFISAGLKDDFVAFLSNLGFEADVHYFEDGELALSEIHKHRYDLILSDYNIDIDNSDFNGDDLINRIREGEIFTEVLFYSAQSNFHDIATSLYQDRVSFFNMVGADALREFKNKVIKLIGLTVAKFQEINSMRGLVMSYTSELDSTVENILHSYFMSRDEKAPELKQYIFEIIAESLNSNLRGLDKLDKKSYSDLVKARIFDADKKARAINKILSIENIDKEESFKDFHAMYKKDVLETRNTLAHSRSENIDGIDYLIVSNKDGEQPSRIDEEQCRDIRKNLRKYSGLLREIKERVCPDV